MNRELSDRDLEAVVGGKARHATPAKAKPTPRAGCNQPFPVFAVPVRKTAGGKCNT